MYIKLDELSASKTYFTMTQTIMPRPIAWILSENADASLNLAPFSYFNAVCSDPPLVMVSIGLQEDGSEKDTLRNIRERPQFVIHIASSSQLEALNQSSATLPPGESEVLASELSTTPFAGYHLPRLSDCKIAMMCERHQIQTIGNNSQALVFGEVKEIYVDDTCAEVNEKGRLKVHADKIQPLARLGGGEFVSFGDILTARRPD
ncbi:MAG: flavin reductase (DIM6/NTAB) family NADH-FMN oxidoreductase RutF [Gammaproteobacteria bacterium]|jgi:flavin reductase (DIM6/NTAB) family NADH-FMN oxidoreductase RutF